jgi:hypothetical protein
VDAAYHKRNFKSDAEHVAFLFAAVSVSRSGIDGIAASDLSTRCAISRDAC